MRHPDSQILKDRIVAEYLDVTPAKLLGMRYQALLDLEIAADAAELASLLDPDSDEKYDAYLVARAAYRAAASR